MKKRFVGIVVCVWMLLGANAWAGQVQRDAFDYDAADVEISSIAYETSATSGDYVYDEINGKVTITGYIGSGGDVVIPSTLEGLPVVAIEGWQGAYCDPFQGCEPYLGAFEALTTLTSVIIPDSVTRIGDSAFESCSALTSVVIPDSVISIGENAFAHSGLTSAIIGNSVISIGRFAFYSCSALTSVTIGDSVTSIGDSAFAYCDGLTSVTIGNSVTVIGSSAFSKCSALTSVIIPDSLISINPNAFSSCSGLIDIIVDVDNSVYSSHDGILYNKDKTVLVVYPGGKPGGFSIPDRVISIGTFAFESCSALTSVVIPDSVTSIGTYAFASSGLTSVIIPDSVTRIGDSAFESCSALTNVTIGNSVTSIGGSVFYSCSALKNVTIGNSVTSIGSSAFQYCNRLTSVVIPDSVTSIGDHAFDGCRGLTSVVIGNSVTSIGDYAFYFCVALTSVTIGDSVTSIGDSAFAYCDGLTSVVIPASLTSIGGMAFVYCDSLSVVYFLGDAPATSFNKPFDCCVSVRICYTAEATGFTTPTWKGYPAAPCACSHDSDCAEGYSCVDGQCIDAPPAIGDGPLVSSDWKVLPTTLESPRYIDENTFVLWTFSDDYAACSEACTHTAEYRAVGDEGWTTLDVSTDPTGEWYAYTELPIDQLQNATTYAFRFSVIDCAGQTTQSPTYYFRVATSDAPPVITAGPYLAAGSWPLLPILGAGPETLTKNDYVLWTFSDDYASCAGLCTHRARYKKVEDAAWTLLSVSTDSEGTDYAYTMLPVEELDEGTYHFYFDVRDCAGQRTYAPNVYTFKVVRP